jgi:uncharacterized membrane protein
MKKFLKPAFSYFIQGLLALLPLIVTIWVIKLVYKFVEGILEDLLFFVPQEFLDNHQFIIKTATIIVMFFAIMFFGIMMRTFFGKLFLSLTDSFFMHIPGLRPIYKAVRQVIDSFSSNKKSFFSNPVLIEYPSKDIWTIGFNTGEVTEEFNPAPGQKRYSVFIPTTPNPTSGFLMIVAEDKIRPLNMKTDRAMQFLLTGGVVKE